MHDQLYLQAGMLIAGVDEAGRGPLAGPVVAAAVILDPANPVEGLADSKKLTARQRERLFDEIRSRALCWASGRAEVDEIDTLNILHASLLAMRRAVMALSSPPDEVWVDGNRCPDIPFPARAIIKGDAKIPAISAASIMAKVIRDREMTALHALHPEYGFDRHKGYPTKLHRECLARFGATPQHRKSFRPVAEVLRKTPPANS